ncbi:MAG: hypothetical protein KVP17_002175 [Porospora cf. gigantea B]|uniref:uncharacterized protein n=1 Tax=Porospora cf. gigantea B TaxID=2853592 RepID=UPI003571E0BE|nr:MAG: hypothetical protein KVP17_002175 [Porospora cf. gigantea B]
MFDAAKKAEQADESSSEEDLKKEQFLAPMEEEFNLFMQNSTFYSSQEQLQDPSDFTYADKDAPAAELAALEESSEEAASESDEDAILAALAIAEGDLLDEDDAESAERDFWLASRQWEFSLNVSSEL